MSSLSWDPREWFSPANAVQRLSAIPTAVPRADVSIQHPLFLERSIELATSGHWLVAWVHNKHRLVVVDTTTLTATEIPPFLEQLQLDGTFEHMWPGRLNGEIFWGSPNRPDVIGVSLHSLLVGRPELTAQIRRDLRLIYSVNMSDGTWLSNGLLGATTLKIGKGQQAAIINIGEEHAGLFPQAVSEQVAMMLNRSSIAASTDRRRLAQAFVMTNALRVYGADGRVRASAFGPIDVPLHYDTYEERGAVRMRLTPETRLAYIDVAANDEMIVALFSGNPYGQRRDAFVFSGYQLHVFDWSGQVLGIFDLPYAVSRIAISVDLPHVWLLPAERNGAIGKIVLPVSP